MRMREKLWIYFATSTVLILIQAACVLGVVMDANPPGYQTNHMGTHAAETLATKVVSPTETSPPHIEPSPTNVGPVELSGIWHGTAQWLCDDNPIWSTKLEFRTNGDVRATVSTNTEYYDADGSWVKNGNEIEIKFETGLWIGTIAENTIRGTFTETNCNGVWSLRKD